MQEIKVGSMVVVFPEIIKNARGFNEASRTGWVEIIEESNGELIYTVKTPFSYYPQIFREELILYRDRKDTKLTKSQLNNFFRIVLNLN